MTVAGARSSFPGLGGGHRPVVVPIADDLRTSWRRWPGRIVVAKPPCNGAPGCKGSAARWCACRCGATFAECNDHLRDVIAERDRHAATCAGAAPP